MVDQRSKALLGQLGDIDLRLLRVFRVVTEAGGLSAAELELNIGRSTISRHIKDLEVRLGVTLCRRGRAGFSLTDEGHNIYQAVLRLLGSIDQFRAEVAQVNEKMTGHISLAFFDKTASNPEAKISQALADFDRIAPDVSLEIYVEPLNEIEKGIMDGRLQLGIVPAHRESTSLNYLPLFKEQMYLYCGKDHPLFERDPESISPAEVITNKYAGLGYHSPNMEIGQRLNMRRAATVYDQETIVHFLMSGRYLGYLPEHYAKFFSDLGLIKALHVPHFQYVCNFMAITRRSPKPSRIVDTFLGCLKKNHTCLNETRL